jgi:hypothetical protein
MLASTRLVIFSTAFMFPAAAFADVTGFDSMHSQRKEAGKTCMTEHFHSGSGSGKTKQAALAAAVRSWREFTAFEYGATWGSWNKAASKSVRYTRENTGWSANVEARPCR